MALPQLRYREELVVAEMDVCERFLGRFAEPLSGTARRRIIVIWHDAGSCFDEDLDVLVPSAEIKFDGR